MTEQEKNEIVEAVWQRIEERTQPVGELAESESLSDFSTLPVIAKDGSLKLCDAARLKGDRGHDGRLRMVGHGTDDTTFALTPNIFHVWGEVETLTLTLAPAEEDILAEYSFQFTCPGDKATKLSLPGTVKWYNDYKPSIDAGKTYQASIVNSVIIIGRY